jgi:hypothetical protein
MSGLLLSMSAKPPVALQKTSLTMSPRWQTAGTRSAKLPWLAGRSLRRTTITVPVVATFLPVVLHLHIVAAMSSAPPPALVVILPFIAAGLIVLSERGRCCTNVIIQRKGKLAQAEHKNESQCATYSLDHVFGSFLMKRSNYSEGGVAGEGSLYMDTTRVTSSKGPFVSDCLSMTKSSRMV